MSGTSFGKNLVRIKLYARFRNILPLRAKVKIVEISLRSTKTFDCTKAANPQLYHGSTCTWTSLPFWFRTKSAAAEGSHFCSWRPVLMKLVSCLFLPWNAVRVFRYFLDLPHSLTEPNNYEPRNHFGWTRARPVKYFSNDDSMYDGKTIIHWTSGTFLTCTAVVWEIKRLQRVLENCWSIPAVV